MKILFLYIDSEIGVNAWPKVHFIDELKRAGHQISFFNPALYSSIDEANEALLILMKENKQKYELFINSYGDNILYKDTVIGISSYGIATLLMCCDNLHAPYMHRKMAPFFDLVWLTSYETMFIFKKWGCKCIMLPYAANPYIFKPNYSEEINAVGFIGTLYGTRVNKVNKLLENNISCTLYSNEFFLSGESMGHNKISQNTKWKIKIGKDDFNLMKFSVGRRILKSKVLKKLSKPTRLLKESEYLKMNPSVSFEQMNQLYSDFSLSLGITEVWDTYFLKNPVYKLHLRTFEIPMCGGLQLTSYTEELAGYFEDGKEILMYKSEDEYIDKASFYLKERASSLRKNMKLAARKRAEHEHTWLYRFNSAFETMGLMK